MAFGFRVFACLILCGVWCVCCGTGLLTGWGLAVEGDLDESALMTANVKLGSYKRTYCDHLGLTHEVGVPIAVDRSPCSKIRNEFAIRPTVLWCKVLTSALNIR